MNNQTQSDATLAFANLSAYERNSLAYHGTSFTTWEDRGDIFCDELNMIASRWALLFGAAESGKQTARFDGWTDVGALAIAAFEVDAGPKRSIEVRQTQGSIVRALRASGLWADGAMGYLTRVL